MKTITISTRNGELSEKPGHGSPGDEVGSGYDHLEKNVLEKNVLAYTQIGVYFQSLQDQNDNSGSSHQQAGSMAFGGEEKLCLYNPPDWCLLRVW